MTKTPRALWSALLAVLCVAASSAADQARTVKYGANDIVSVKAKVRFTTLIVLPEGETIIDYVVGDKDFWVVEGQGHLAYIKPAREGAATNVTLVTAAGHLYSFLFTEVSGRKEEPDLKVFIEPSSPSLIQSLTPRLAPASDVAAAQEAAMRVVQEVRRQGESLRAEYPLSFRFEYSFDRGKDSFGISAMYHDGRFTFIHVTGSEKPALYEEADGEASLVSFDVRDGIYVVPKMLNKGYLVLGKTKLNFARKRG